MPAKTTEEQFTERAWPGVHTATSVRSRHSGLYDPYVSPDANRPVESVYACPDPRGVRLQYTRYPLISRTSPAAKCFVSMGNSERRLYFENMRAYESYLELVHGQRLSKRQAKEVKGMFDDAGDVVDAHRDLLQVRKDSRSILVGF